MATTKMNPMTGLRKQLDSNGVEVLQRLIKDTVQQLVAAEVDTICGREHGARNGDTVDSRNAFRQRAWDTRAGAIDLESPKLRQGTYHSGWLLEPRKRSERALCQVVAECYVQSVGIRRVDKLVRASKIDSSQV